MLSGFGVTDPESIRSAKESVLGGKACTQVLKFL